MSSSLESTTPPIECQSRIMNISLDMVAFKITPLYNWQEAVMESAISLAGIRSNMRTHLINS